VRQSGPGKIFIWRAPVFVAGQINRQGWTVVQEFTDHAISGATVLRFGFQALMRDASNARFDVVLAEALDRFSRDQEDTAGLFKRLTFAGVNIVTIAEGDITHLHIGFKGTINALFLKDLAERTRRGLHGRIENGKSAGGRCYGYRVVKTRNGGSVTTGEREIEPAEAAIAERIFRDFIGGISPKQIAKNLNREGIAGPFGDGRLYRQKVTTLAQALAHPETRTEATAALRGLIDAIVMTPADGGLRIELKGNLAAMLGATVQSKRAPELKPSRCKYRWLRGHATSGTCSCGVWRADAV
jgi:DNA invertase Pin-like site-specific DNA recombinase